MKMGLLLSIGLVGASLWSILVRAPVTVHARQGFPDAMMLPLISDRSRLSKTPFHAAHFYRFAGTLAHSFPQVAMVGAASRPAQMLMAWVGSLAPYVGALGDPGGSVVLAVTLLPSPSQEIQDHALIRAYNGYDLESFRTLVRRSNLSMTWRAILIEIKSQCPLISDFDEIIDQMTHLEFSHDIHLEQVPGRLRHFLASQNKQNPESQMLNRCALSYLAKWRAAHRQALPQRFEWTVLSGPRRRLQWKDSSRVMTLEVESLATGQIRLINGYHAERPSNVEDWPLMVLEIFDHYNVWKEPAVHLTYEATDGTNARAFMWLVGRLRHANMLINPSLKVRSSYTLEVNPRWLAAAKAQNESPDGRAASLGEADGDVSMSPSNLRPGDLVPDQRRKEKWLLKLLIKVFKLSRKHIPNLSRSSFLWRLYAVDRQFHPDLVMEFWKKERYTREPLTPLGLTLSIFKEQPERVPDLLRGTLPHMRLERESA